jgi:glycosyltransferase involved in cell wall biosynthesis
MLLPPRRLSVLHIFNDCYPDLFGGAVSVIRDICAGLQNAFTACVLVCSRSRGQRRLLVNGVTVERVRSFGDVGSLPAAPTYPLRLWRRVSDYDVLALHAPFPLADLMFALRMGRHQSLVVHYHADSVSQPGLRWFTDMLMRRTLRRADAVVVSSATLLDGSRLLPEFAEKCHIVPFGVDAGKYDWPVQRAGVADAGRDRGGLVLACGQLVASKGFDVLVQAAVGQRFEVWIVGEGPEQARLERMIDSLGVADRVRLLGSAPRAKLVKFMRTADIFVLPSVTNAETFGMAQLEAMAAGLPIINTSLDTAVPRVARHGIEAITVPPGDHAGLAEAIDILLGDPERRRCMGRAARLRATRQYSSDVFRRRIETVYRQAVTTSASSGSTLPSRRATRSTGSEIDIADADRAEIRRAGSVVVPIRQKSVTSKE